MAFDGPVGPPLVVRLAGGPRPAIEGELFNGALAVKALDSTELSSLQIAAEGWGPITFTVPENVILGPGDTTAFPFSGTPEQGAGPVCVGFTYRHLDANVQNEWSVNSISCVDLSPSTYTITMYPSELEPRPGSPFLKLYDSLLEVGQEEGDARPTTEDATGSSYDIRISGTIVYQRPDGTLEGLDGATIYVYDYDSDCFDERDFCELIGSGNTDRHGNLSYKGEGGIVHEYIDASSDESSGPDIMIEVELDGDGVKTGHIMTYDFWGDELAGYTSSTYSRILSNYTGSSLDLDTLCIVEEKHREACHIHTNITRAWRWIRDYINDTLPRVQVAFPSALGSSSFSAQGTNLVCIKRDAAWLNDIIWHEYGHRYMWKVTCNPTLLPQYCDEWHHCDDLLWVVTYPSYYEFWVCNHCGSGWCDETETAAWVEGWATYFADLMAREMTDINALIDVPPPYSANSVEEVQSCPEYSGNENIARQNEGHVAAALRDIEDADSDQDGFHGTTLEDNCNDGYYNIFRVLKDKYQGDCILSMFTFLRAYRDYDFSPYLDEGCQTIDRPTFWAAVRMNGIEIDEELPSPLQLVTSTPGPGNADNTDATIDFTWHPAADYCSGVKGYWWAFSTDRDYVPDSDDHFADGSKNSLTATIPTSGTEYWFHIRTLDRSGKMSNGWQTIPTGPGDMGFIFKPPSPEDLSYCEPGCLPAGWRDPLVPKGTPDATLGLAQFSDLLVPGYKFYWNAMGVNLGETPTTANFRLRFEVDGERDTSYVIGSSYGEDEAYAVLNYESGHVGQSGRHTLHVMHDAGEVYSEPNENNNFFGLQLVWEPEDLILENTLMREAPMSKRGGWEYVREGDPYDNCAGFRIESTNDWNAVVVWPVSTEENYDCRLHAPSNNCQEGFDVVLEESDRPEGYLDALFVNGNLTGSTNYDIGVVEHHPEDDVVHDGFRIRYITSSNITREVLWPADMGQHEWMKLGQLYVGVPPSNRYLTVSVTASPSYAPVYVKVGTPTYEKCSLSDFPVLAAGHTDESGQLITEFELLTGPGGLWYPACVYRRPFEWRTEKGATDPTADPVDVDILIYPSTADVSAYTPEGWHSPLVPRPANDGTPTFAPLPANLWGNAPSTWLNIAGSNTGRVTTPSYIDRVCLDGEELHVAAIDPKDPGVTYIRNESTPFEVRGGRHTLTCAYDADDVVAETFEENNAHAEQYVWSPYTLSLNTSVTRTKPPDPLGGWAAYGFTEPRYYNCDGLQTPVFAPSGDDGYWAAIAIVPTDFSLDVDLSLYEVASGVKDGYSSGIYFSGWGKGESDFGVINFRKTIFRPFQAGVTAISTADRSYVARAVSSSFHTLFDGWTESFLMPANSFVDLHEFSFEADDYEIVLTNESGVIDWGMTLHPFELPYCSKLTSVPGGIAWLNGAGQGETLSVHISTAANYCLSVWKTRSENLADEGSYTLSITQGCCDGRVGDANGSGEDMPTIGDVSVMIDAKFISGTCDGIVGCLAEADANVSGGAAPTCDDITIGDISMLIDCLFITGEPPFVRNDCAQ